MTLTHSWERSLDPKSSHDFAKSAFNNPYGPPPEESEDCLYLNVYAPASPAPSSGRAVMVWIYGGNLQFGTGGIEVYDGSSLAANGDVIVVTFNYRTNGRSEGKIHVK